MYENHICELRSEETMVHRCVALKIVVANPDSGIQQIFTVKSGILVFGIRNTAQGI